MRGTAKYVCFECRTHRRCGNYSTLHALSSFTERQNEKKCKKTNKKKGHKLW